MRTIGKLLIFGACLLFAFAIWRSFFYYPNNEDSGLTAALASTSSATITASQRASLPIELIIPKLTIDAKVQDLGITWKGNMAAPNNFTDVSWYKLGTIPGNIGSAVMAGHEDNAAALDGVFKHLGDLAIGDDVYVVEANGTKLHFRVTEKEIYPYNLSGTDLKRVFNATDAARLNLITCSGHWVQSIKTNNERLVVFTELVK